MQCPFCAEEIKDEAIFCRYCQHDISIPKVIIEQNKAFIEKIADLEEKMARRHAEQNKNVLVPSLQSKGSPIRLFLKNATFYILRPVFLLAVVHYLMLTAFNDRLVYINLVCMAIGLPFGYDMSWRTRRGVGTALGVGGTVGAVVVAAMSAMVSLQFGDPILPNDARIWQDSIELAISITLAFVAGNALGGLMRRTLPSEAESDDGFAVTARAIAEVIGRPHDVKVLSDRIDSIAKILNAVTALLTAIGAVYLGTKNVVH